jgi:hypothetical protein
MDYAKAGITTVEEVMRITSERIEDTEVLQEPATV